MVGWTKKHEQRNNSVFFFLSKPTIWPEEVGVFRLFWYIRGQSQSDRDNHKYCIWNMEPE